MKKNKKCNREWYAWGVRWESNSRLDGEQRWLIGSANTLHYIHYITELQGCTGSLMFESRRACQEYIKEKYGYIRDRKDLREEPHGWRMPKATRIKIVVKEF